MVADEFDVVVVVVFGRRVVGCDPQPTPWYKQHHAFLPSDHAWRKWASFDVQSKVKRCEVVPVLVEVVVVRKRLLEDVVVPNVVVPVLVVLVDVLEVVPPESAVALAAEAGDLSIVTQPRPSRTQHQRACATDQLSCQRSAPEEQSQGFPGGCVVLAGCAPTELLLAEGVEVAFRTSARGLCARRGGAPTDACRARMHPTACSLQQ